MSCRSLSQENPQQYGNTSCIPEPSTNRFIYIKQHMAENSSHTSNGSQKVLVNPHFKKNKVFVNPNFSGIPIQPNTIHVNPHIKNLKVPILNSKQCIKSQPYQENVPLQSTKIHINPNAKGVQIPLNISQVASQTVHINPNFKNPSVLSNILQKNSLNISPTKRKEIPSEQINKTTVLTRTKLIRTPVVKKRRNSIKSKYKIVKSLHSSPKRNTLGDNEAENNRVNKSKNKYKIDNRRRNSFSIIAKHQRKYVYINKFLSIRDLAKTHIIKSIPTSPGKSATVNIRGVVYRKSRNSIRRASVSSAPLKESPSGPIQVSKYKLVKCPAIKKAITNKPVPESKDRACDNTSMVSKMFKVIRRASLKKSKSTKVSPRKLKKCNIPCPYYKKYGLCKGKENGKCFRKHDPDQIALCTRFLQGACLKEKCLLSHNVSSEKMPTCKYYLEGSCSRENCPYLHVKINPKAEVCRDFLEGFCKKAAECDKRHQYLCPEYEKYGKCLKQRCPYPHGKMVRNYMSDKAKFAKKSSKFDKKPKKQDQKFVSDKICSKSVKSNDLKNEQAKENPRYYLKKSKSEGISDEPSTSGDDSTLEKPKSFKTIEKSTTKNYIGLKSRPKLGTLPAFIPFDK